MAWNSSAMTMRQVALRASLVVGVAVFLCGQGILASAFFQGTQGATASIPAGPAWYYVYQIDVVGPGRVVVSFEDTAGTSVDVYVFGSRDYRAYSLIGLGNSLVSSRGTSGNFSVALPGTGTYYLVLDHGAGFEEALQEVRVSMRLIGVESNFLGVGLLLVSVGTVAVGLGLRRRRPS